MRDARIGVEHLEHVTGKDDSAGTCDGECDGEVGNGCVEILHQI